MKREIGDKVRIRKDLVVDEMYGNTNFIVVMNRFKGLEATINKISSDYYYLDIDDGRYCWTDEMLEDVQEETQDAQNPNDIIESLARKLTPQSFSSNDGRFTIEVIEGGYLELTMTELEADQYGHMQEKTDNVQKLEINYKDLEMLIEVLQVAKQIETRTWKEIKKQFK